MQLKDKIISVEVIPSTPVSKWTEPYSEHEIHGYTTDFNEWLEFALNEISLSVKSDLRYAIKHNKEYDAYSSFEVETLLKFSDVFRKFKHYATKPVFKAGSEKMYTVLSRDMTEEQIRNMNIPDNMVLYYITPKRNCEMGDQIYAVKTSLLT